MEYTHICKKEVFLFSFKKILFFNYSLHSCYFVLDSGVQYSGQAITYFKKWSLWCIQYPLSTRQNYYNIIDYIHYAVLYVPVIIL